MRLWLNCCLKANSGGWFSSFVLRNSELLSRILATGRAVDADQDELLHLGEPIAGHCQWILTQNGQQSLSLTYMSM